LNCRLPLRGGGRFRPLCYIDLRAANQKAGLSWTCLDCRHTFGSQLAMKGEGLCKIATLMGNPPEICRRHSAALLREALSASEKFSATTLLQRSIPQINTLMTQLAVSHRAGRRSGWSTIAGSAAVPPAALHALADRVRSLTRPRKKPAVIQELEHERCLSRHSQDGFAEKARTISCAQHLVV
jgi:hypothetical protein